MEGGFQSVNIEGFTPHVTLHHSIFGACSRWLPTAAAAPPISHFIVRPHFVNAQVFIKSGISPTASYLPACVHPKHTREPNTDIPSALAESEMVMWVQLTVWQVGVVSARSVKVHTRDPNTDLPPRLSLYVPPLSL